MITISSTQAALSPAVRRRFRAFSEALGAPVTGLDEVEQQQMVPKVNDQRPDFRRKSDG